MSPEQEEVARILLDRARSDLRACSTLARSEVMEDDVVGFHAQQAIEKSIKVALVLKGIDFPRTHDLDFLLDRAEAGGLSVPGEIEATSWLTPWAAELRYDEGPAALDRDGALAAAQRVVEWATSLLEESA